MSAAQVVGADAEAYACAVENGFPDVLAEPGSKNVPVGGEGAAAGGLGDGWASIPVPSSRRFPYSSLAAAATVSSGPAAGRP